MTEAAAIEERPQPVSAGMSISLAAARLSEAVALLGAGLYALGVLRITGELRELHLSTPTVLAGFSHHDVLMKGVGVLVSHLSSSVLMISMLALFASRAMLDGVNRVVTHAYRPTVTEQLTIGLVAIVLLLSARFWEGGAYVLLVYALFYTRYRRRSAVGRGMVVAMLVLGMVFTGILGSYMHAPPLMTITAHRQGKVDHGYLVGSGNGGEWFVATHHGDSYNLEVLGGSSGEKVDEVLIHPANDRDYRTVLYQLLHGFQGYRFSRQP